MKIYVDMDGVLAAHDEYVAQRLGDNASYEQMQKLQRSKGFFQNLNKTDIADALIQAIVGLYGAYSIISTPNVDNFIDGGLEKLRWIQSHLYPSPENVIFTEDKSLYANGNVLIDDYRPNIAAWREAGGIGLKYRANSPHYNLNDLIRSLGALK